MLKRLMLTQKEKERLEQLLINLEDRLYNSKSELIYDVKFNKIDSMIIGLFEKYLIHGIDISKYQKVYDKIINNAFEKDDNIIIKDTKKFREEGILRGDLLPSNKYEKSGYPRIRYLPSLYGSNPKYK